MLSASTLDLPAPPRNRPLAPLILSALIHGLVALAWVGFPLPESRTEQPPAISVDIVPPPPPKPAPPKVEPPVAPAPQAAAPVPQLREGALAERSHAEAKPAGSGEAVAVDKPRKPKPVTQNERDFVLAQVVRHWKPPAELAARPDAAVSLEVEVRPDGYFAEFYDARRKWNPAEAVEGYGMLPPDALERRTVDAFYGAIRKAQPVRLPPQLKEKAPFKVKLRFRFRDIQ